MAIWVETVDLLQRARVLGDKGREGGREGEREGGREGGKEGRRPQRQQSTRKVTVVVLCCPRGRKLIVGRRYVYPQEELERLFLTLCCYKIRQRCWECCQQWQEEMCVRESERVRSEEQKNKEWGVGSGEQSEESGGVRKEEREDTYFAVFCIILMMLVISSLPSAHKGAPMPSIAHHCAWLPMLSLLTPLWCVGHRPLFMGKSQLHPIMFLPWDVSS